MPSGSLPTIAMSLRRLQGKNTASLMLFLLSLDLKHVYRRQHEESVERGQVFADNFDLGYA